MKIPKVTPKLPFFSNLISWPVCKWRSFYTPLHFLFSKPQPGILQTLVDLRDLPGVYAFQCFDDRDIGGLSEGFIDWTANGAEFSGFIDSERAAKMVELPYVLFQHRFWLAARGKANLIRIEARRLPIPETIEQNEGDKVLPLLVNFKAALLDLKSNVDLFVSLGH